MAGESEVVALSSRWVSAVAEQDPALVLLFSSDAGEYYAHLADLALRGSIPEVLALDPVDQLQVFFLRLTIEPHVLARMSGDEILLRAIDERWIGQDLRRTDELREVVVEGDAAEGRLYKFGRSDRPDRGRQYFLREGGDWRVSLRGERERLRADFDAFVARSGLSRSEATFFILETRLLRKVMPADFVAPLSEDTPDIELLPVTRTSTIDAARRLVSVRESPDDPDLAAVTIDDPVQSLRYVVRVGEPENRAAGYRLLRVSGNRAWLTKSGDGLVLQLDPAGPALDERFALTSMPSNSLSLLDQARLGENREGMMSQWRNVGLRGRPQLLQQASLVPVVLADGGGIDGLRVRDLVAGSFWDQLGLAEGDVLKEVNGARLDSMARWQELLRIAETEQEIAIVVLRAGRKLRFLTRTIPARRTDGPA